MNIEQVTLDNGTTIGYGVDDYGNPDFSVIEIQTDHEYMVIQSTISLNELGMLVPGLAITDLDEIAADEDDDDDDEGEDGYCGDDCLICAAQRAGSHLG